MKNQENSLSEIKAIKESAPLQAEYQKWLDSHKQVDLKPAGEDQYKNLNFDDEKIPSVDFDDKEWPVMTIPSTYETVIGEFDGAVWFRKVVEIPESMAGKDMVLSLGPIDDMDATYFNGQLVGSTELSGFWQAERKYDIPASLVKAGKNVIAVRVLDTQGGGGIYGKPEKVNIFFKKQSKAFDSS